MRGDNALLAVTTTVDPATGDIKPLFAFPIQVCKATEEQEVKLDIRAPSGAAREQRYIDSSTGEIVEDEDCLRGIAVGDDLREIDPEDWKSIGEQVKAKTETMVSLGSVDLTPDFWQAYGDRVTGRYFLQSPAKGGVPKAYRLLYEGLCEQRKGKRLVAPARAIVTKRVPRTKQKLCLIFANEKLECLMLVELAFADAIREPDAQVLAPRVAEVTAEQVEKVREVIATLGDGQPALETEVDEAVALRRELVEKALDGQEITAPRSKAETTQETNLEALLTASLEAASAKVAA